MLRRRAVVVVAAVVGCVGVGCGDMNQRDPTTCTSPSFIERVVSFDPGDGAGFGQDRMPDVVLGAPAGGKDSDGSTDVVSLGTGGSIVVAFCGVIDDNDGPDFFVYENAFHYGDADAGNVFGEPAAVSVSNDGETFHEFPCAPQTAADDGVDGCAGLAPVVANDDNGRSGTVEGGGDAFDLATVGLARARFVKIVDSGVGADFGGDSAGFDLDAIAVAVPDIAD